MLIARPTLSLSQSLFLCLELVNISWQLIIFRSQFMRSQFKFLQSITSSTIKYIMVASLRIRSLFSQGNVTSLSEEYLTCTRMP